MFWVEKSALEPPGVSARLYLLLPSSPSSSLILTHSRQRSVLGLGFLRSHPGRLTHRATPQEEEWEDSLALPAHLGPGSDTSPDLKTLTPPGRDFAAARSPPGRWRCGLAGCVYLAIWSRRPASLPPPHVQPLRAVVACIRLNLLLGAGNGGSCGGDARVPGGAETVAERAADPGVRPALGVWAARRSA